VQPLFWSNPHEAIKNAYDSTNKYILENAKQLGPGGSTAVTAIVVDGKDMWIANVGDSRAVLCERGAANQITVDHEPHTTNERQRIEQQGGFVTTFPGMILILQLSPHVLSQTTHNFSFAKKKQRIIFMCAIA
jgi:protein phosphatase 1L